MKVSEIMIKCIRSEVFGCEITKSELEEIRDVLCDGGYDKLYKLSSFHDVAHLVGSALHKYGLSDQADIAKKLYKTKFSAAFRCEKIIKELASLMDTLELAEIDHIALKGSVIRGLYPQAWMRCSPISTM